MALVGPNAIPDYTYKATILRWVDGDTVWLTVDLGFRFTMTSDFRLYGVNTPERGQTGYSEATAFTNQLAPQGSDVVIKSYKDPDKYGRWIVQIFAGGAVATGQTDINEAIIAGGFGVPYFGGTKSPAVTPS